MSELIVAKKFGLIWIVTFIIILYTSNKNQLYLQPFGNSSFLLNRKYFCSFLQKWTQSCANVTYIVKYLCSISNIGKIQILF